MSFDFCPNSSSYEPSSLVTAFHGIPHIDIDLEQNITEFENTQDYYETIIIWSCVPVLAALCIFILMSVYFICVCCCCCCQQHEKRSKCSIASCGIFVTLLIVLSIALCGVALWAEFSLDNHINSANEAAVDANDAVQNVSTTAQTLDFDELSSDVNTLADAIADSSGSIGFDDATAAVDQLRTELPNVRTAFMEIISNADIEDFNSTLDTIDAVEVARHWTVVAYVILTIVILVVMLLSVCCGAICGTPHCMVISLVMFSFYAFIMWIAVGGNLGYLVIAGDICNDPDRIIRMEFVGEAVSADELQYYLVCNETCYPNPFSEFEMDANVALDTIMAQQSVIRNFTSVNNLPNVEMALVAVVNAVDSAAEAITDISSLTECTTLNTDYLQVLEDFCTDGYMFSLILFAMACSLAITFILIIFCGSFYAGLFSQGKSFDDETIVYDFPNEDGPSPWQSYGTQQRYHNTQTQYTESFNMAGGQQQPEPPKYTDLHQESHMNGNMHPGMPGNYDS